MARIGIVPNENSSINCQNKYENWFNYNWVLNELTKDFDIEGIDRIGFTSDGYEVFIVTDDYMLSNIPHFHYCKKDKGQKIKFHTCIRFDKAKYYYHLGNEDNLNASQKKNLIKFLNSKPQYFSNLETNWERAIFSWNHQNDYKNVIEDNLPMPNYMELKK